MIHEPRYAIVTGAGSGLGRALCLRLAAEGWIIAVCDRDTSTAEESLQLVHSAGGDGLVCSLDVTDPDAWLMLRQQLQADWPRLDLLINNAGVSAGGKSTAMSLDDWRFVLDVNLYGVIHGCQAMVPWLLENPDDAHLINTASLAGLMAAPDMGPYNVSKAAVVALSETLYAELASQGVGVTVLCPGFFATNLLNRGRFATEKHLSTGRRYMEHSKFTADDIAKLALKAMRRKRLYVVHGFKARSLWRLKRMSPAGFHRLAARLYRKLAS